MSTNNQVTVQRSQEYCIPTTFKPVIDSVIGHPAIVAVVTLLAAHAYKNIEGWFTRKVESTSASLWLSEAKDDQVNEILLLLREATESDRLVLGLLVNGESNLDRSYHIRRVVITHESKGAGVPSIRSLGQERFLATALNKEESLYRNANFVAKTASDPLIEAGCRRYLDSINAIAILTVKLYREEFGKKLTLGYLSFQWTASGSILSSVPPGSIADIEELLRSKGRRDFTFYQNKILQILAENSDRRNLIERLAGLISIKKHQSV